MNRKNSDDFAGLVSYEKEYQELALRYEVGEHSNFILIPMLHASLKQVLKWDANKIQKYCQELMSQPINELQDLGYSLENANYRANHLFGLKPPNGVSIEQVKMACKRNKVSVSFRGERIRVSPHVYNDEMDTRKLLKALKEPILAP